MNNTFLYDVYFCMKCFELHQHNHCWQPAVICFFWIKQSCVLPDKKPVVAEWRHMGYVCRTYCYWGTEHFWYIVILFDKYSEKNHIDQQWRQVMACLLRVWCLPSVRESSVFPVHSFVIVWPYAISCNTGPCHIERLLDLTHPDNPYPDITHLKHYLPRHYPPIPISLE